MMFDAKAFIAEQVGTIRKAVPGRAIIACSGGVDSTTAAVLASRALGDRLLAVYVDTGLMRKDETADVSKTLKELAVQHRILLAADEFFDALRGITDPERVRDCLKPFDPKLMRKYPVSNRVNRPENDDETCAQEIPPDNASLNLFEPPSTAS